MSDGIILAIGALAFFFIVVLPALADDLLIATILSGRDRGTWPIRVAVLLGALGIVAVIVAANRG